MPLNDRTGRRALVALAVVVVAAVVGGVVFAVRQADDDPATATPGDQPNIVVVMTDDQTVESMRAMPHVRELIGGQGLTFSESVASFALCCPSRATFLTGQYAHNHAVWGNQPPEGGYEAFDDQETTLPVALQNAGYDTVHVGKYLNGYGSDDPVEAPPGWSEWYTELDPRTQRYYGFTLLENGVTKKYERPQYSSDVFTELATSAVRSHAEGDEPLFLTVSYFAPHADFSFEDGLIPATPAPRHLGSFDGEPLPDSIAFDEEDVSDKPQAVQARPRISDAVRATMTTNYARYLESLQAVDEGVEQIVDALDETGQLEDTVIIFTSDNGYLFGEHRIPSGKVWFYEPSIRVPLLMRGPGIEADAVRQSLVANIDLAPTILELAGATSLRTVDGRSLVPLFAGEGDPPERNVLLEAGVPDAADYGLRTSRYSYFELATGERELYDLAADPGQLDNRHGAPEMAAVEADLAEQIARLKDCAGESCN